MGLHFPFSFFSSLHVFLFEFPMKRPEGLAQCRFLRWIRLPCHFLPGAFTTKTETGYIPDRKVSQHKLLTSDCQHHKVRLHDAKGIQIAVELMPQGLVLLSEMVEKGDHGIKVCGLLLSFLPSWACLSFRRKVFCCRCFFFAYVKVSAFLPKLQYQEARFSWTE